MSLSLLLAKRHYGYVVLYTNQEVGDIVKKIGLPYDEINTDVLKDVNVKTFSVPKLVVYSQQTEPYIHIDLDTFIFKKIFFNDFENIYSTFAEGSGDILNFERTNTSFYTTYVKRSFEIQSKLPEEFLKYVKFNNVPNMSVFGGHNFELIKESSKYCLELYQNHTDFFDSNYYNACIIEQLFIPAAMRMIKGDHNLENFKFLFEYNPTYIEFSKGKDWDFPFGIRCGENLSMIDDYQNLFKKVNLQFFIEHISLEYPLETFPADKSYIFVNQEYIQDWDIARMKDKTIIPLCKTREGLKTLNKLDIPQFLCG